MILTKLMSLENSMINQLLVHFKLSKISHMENVPEMPIDSDERLENVERF